MLKNSLLTEGVNQGMNSMIPIGYLRDLSKGSGGPSVSHMHCAAVESLPTDTMVSACRTLVQW